MYARWQVNELMIHVLLNLTKKSNSLHPASNIITFNFIEWPWNMIACLDVWDWIHTWYLTYLSPYKTSDIFRVHFQVFYWTNVSIPIETSLTSVPYYLLNNMAPQALLNLYNTIKIPWKFVPEMLWRRTCGHPLPKPKISALIDEYVSP